MNLLQDSVAGPAAERLGWTLVHFGWQGAAIAAALAVLLHRGRSGSAGARYVLCCAALGLMAAAPVATFRALPAGAPNSRAAPVTTAAGTADAAGASDLRARASRSTRAVAVRAGRATLRPPDWGAAAGQTARLLTAFWAVGVVALSARLVVHAVSIGLLRRSGVPLGREHCELPPAVARRVGLRHVPRVLESAWPEVPTVVGWVRPLVLVPVGLLSGLTPFEIESILAHEFAHVRRRDYLVNLLQSVVEVLLFYHPAVWWVSGRIRAERENCCDDLAAAVCGDPVRYARVLARLEGLRSAPAHAALAASGGTLLSRVRRLLDGAEPRCRPRPWTAAGSAVATALAIALAFAGHPTVATADRSPLRERPRARPGPAAHGGAVERGQRGQASRNAEASPPLQGVAARGGGVGQLDGPSAGAVRSDSATGAEGRSASATSVGAPFDRLTSVTEAQRSAIMEFRQLQAEAGVLKAARRDFTEPLSPPHRRQVQQALARRPAQSGGGSSRRADPNDRRPDRSGPSGTVDADADLSFLTDAQKAAFLDLCRRHSDWEKRMRAARAAVMSALTAEQRRQMQGMRPGNQAGLPGRDVTRSAAARGGTRNSGVGGVVVRLEGARLFLRGVSPGGAAGSFDLVTDAGTAVQIDGEPAEVAALKSGDRVRVAYANGVATRISARSAGGSRPTAAHRKGLRPRPAAPAR